MPRKSLPAAVPPAGAPTAPTVAVLPAVVSTEGLAVILDCHAKHVARLDRAGKLPRPIRLGKSKKFVLAEVYAWLEAGAPNRLKWESLKASQPFRIAQ